MTRLLSTADASRLLGVTPATVRLMARRGTLGPAATTESGIRLFDRRDVERLVKSRAAKGAHHGP
jgi:DNA-binding transcriptional MerR regulator